MAATYGVSALGVSKTHLKALRVGIASVAFPASSFRSTTLSFLLEPNLDPEYLTTQGVLVGWAEMWWDCSLTHEDMRSSFQ